VSAFPQTAYWDFKFTFMEWAPGSPLGCDGVTISEILKLYPRFAGAV
jgi:hypothetical protein